MSRQGRMLEFSFALLSVVVVWNLELLEQIDRLANGVGLRDPSLGRTIMEGITVPLVIALLATIAQASYRIWIWPLLPSSGGRSGLWLYVLIAQTQSAEITVGGWFSLQHTATGSVIPQARAFYLDDTDLVFRGDWTSDMVSVGPRRISFVFEMNALGVTRESAPSHYEGFMQLGIRPGAPGRKNSLWIGYFHDLGDRRGVHGPVAGIRVVSRRRDSSHEEILLTQAPMLRNCVLELLGRRPAAASGEPVAGE